MNISPGDFRKIRIWAAAHAEVMQVYLYGSRARGDNRPDSDIDLAIVMRPDEGQDNAYEVWAFWEGREDHTLHLSHKVHLEWYEKGAHLERVGPGVEKDGVLIYQVE